MLLSAALLLAPASAFAQEDANLAAGGNQPQSGSSIERGMPASNARVKSILAAHPGELLTICVAGCGKPQIVQALPKPKEIRSGAMRTTAGGTAPAAPKAAYDSIDRDAVICVAGCGGKSDRVVQQMQGLPTPPKTAPARVDKGVNEPLDVR
jgi:hypothetical protein